MLPVSGFPGYRVSEIFALDLVNLIVADDRGTQAYVLVSIHLGGNTVDSIRCKELEEGDILLVVKLLVRWI